MSQLVSQLKQQWPAIRFVADNVGWIGTSLAIALIIWIVASLDDNPVEQRPFDELVPITFIDKTDNDIVLLTSATLDRNAQVSVTIRAPRNSFEDSDADNRITLDNIEVTADLSNLSVGHILYHFKAD